MKAREINTDEYFHYFKRYIDQVGDLPLLEALEKGRDQTHAFFNSLPEAKHHFKYDNNKWTPKEILLHLIDTERVFNYRALYFARAENSSLEGFDENVFAQFSRANERSMDDLLEEYNAVRTATLKQFNSFDNAVMQKGGKASGNLISVRAIGFILCGHEIHHRKVIQDRYL